MVSDWGQAHSQAIRNVKEAAWDLRTVDLDAGVPGVGAKRCELEKVNMFVFKMLSFEDRLRHSHENQLLMATNIPYFQMEDWKTNAS